MATQVGPLLSFNRGVLSKTTLARTDLDRTRLSAEVMTNFLPKTQGPMIIRPGTKYLGSSLRDTGAAWIEFVATTTDIALLELTGGDTGTTNKMRVWLPQDTGNSWETPAQSGVLVPMARPAVNTTVTLTDTGWSNVSTGGTITTVATDVIPAMTAATTNGVTITASAQNTWDNADGTNKSAWKVADNSIATEWRDTGGTTSFPEWLNVDFGTDTGNRKSVRSYSMRASDQAFFLEEMPAAWRLITGNFDTGTFATDTGKWTLEDERSAQTGWAVSEKRSFTLPGADTGTVEVRRHWRLHVVSNNGGANIILAEVEMFDAASAQQVKLTGGARILNANSRGARAIARKRVILSDTGTEHSLAIQISRGPVTLRVGSTSGNDDYIVETSLGTGYHNLAFVPHTDFWIDIRSDEMLDRIVSSLTIGDSGTVEITTPWTADDLDDVRYDQSADVVYVDCDGIRQRKIERRGTGRSWSVVAYEPNNGPFLSSRTSSAKFSIGAKLGNTSMYSDIPFFTEGQTGTLFRMTHEGQTGKWYLGAADAKSDVIEVTGIGDTGATIGFTDTGTSQLSERRIHLSVSGTYSGRVVLERSFDGADFGFKEASQHHKMSGSVNDTGSFEATLNDRDDNITVFYRVRMTSWTSGVAVVTLTYRNGSVTGTARVTGFVDNQEVNVEVLEQFSDTGGVDNWQESAWSERRGFPTAVALHEGRLFHAGQANVWGSVSDDYENFDIDTEGESGPIIRTLGSGPVDIIRFMLSLLRLVAGTTGSEIAIKSSSLDETLTPTNSAARTFSTQGSTSLRALKMDSRGLFVQRSGERVFMIGFGTSADSISEYTSTELTLLVPEYLRPGVVSIAIQRQPDTRIHCVLADGTVAILTYEPQEEVLAWSKWVTDTGSNSAVERAMVLPGAQEDQVFYHIRRTINGVTRRFLEKWAMESECRGDTGLSWLMDCAVSQTDTGAALILADFAPHLAGQTVAGWANDTGQNNSVGRDLTPDDTGGTQVLLAVDTGGDLTLLDSGPKHVVAGLPYRADFKSTKLAYGAQGTTAMTMLKRVSKIALILNQTHNNAIFVGGDTGHLDPMPRVSDEGSTVDANKIFEEYDRFATPFDGEWDEDSRLHIRAKSPRPVTIMAALPHVTTNEH